ncbi:methyl-accepting chemotaxis protein [Niallia sp. MER TA 168]|uniref:methyl-accepting chemotaxis protein n=1 Tax=Niallia sp. MER TA 168 TaxID=2939568 RepID=UPI002041E608|nr:methyl-accepting chemotaxis protein [Niallia sp. MER TA 168]MCM3360628.1 methyl-accepting chemotaxis protein [Niallia sp. MER TA 168]
MRILKSLNQNLKLSTKLYIAFALILIVPTITVAYLSIQSAKHELSENIMESTKENVKLLNSSIDSTISPKLYDANYLADIITGELFEKQGDNPDALMSKLDQYKGLHPEAVAVYLGTQDGKMYTSPALDLPDDYDPRDRTWFTQAMNNSVDKAIVTNPYIDASSKEMVVTITRKTADGSGVIGIDLNLSTLEKTTKEVAVGNEGFILLLDTEQNYLVSPINEAGTKVDQNFPDLYEQNSGVHHYKTNGQDRTLYYLTNENTGWKIVGSMLDAETNAAVKPILQKSLLVVVASIIFGGAIIILIIRSLVSRLKEIQNKAKKISDGDLTEEITLQSNDEIGQLAHSFTSMQSSLKTLLKTLEHHSLMVSATAEELNASAGQTSEASEQVATAIQHVAVSAEKQTEGVEANILSLNQIVNSTNTVLLNANGVLNRTKTTTQNAEVGKAIVQQTVNQMNEIHHSVSDTNKVIASLHDRTKEIGAIVDVITAISNQTNLLALNAAIEAARAGESGQGFTVVADEVRKLAEQSQISASQITEIIKAIQQDTKETVHTMSTVECNVQKGIEISDEAINTFMEIYDNMNLISPQMSQVASTLNDILTFVQNTEKTAELISDLAKNNAASSEEVAASTEEQLAAMEEISSSANTLASMTEDLIQLIKKYKF